MTQFPFHPAGTLKEKPKDESKLGFGQIFTDYMFTMRYSKEEGWHDGKIEPYAPFCLEPATMVFHYGQAMFEGLKAYRTPTGGVQLFRPRDNFMRMNRSADRLSMPELDVDQAMSGLMQLMSIERDWVPHAPGTSLYIRPTMIATDPYVGVRSSYTYLFFIILSPVGAYYAGGLNPVRIYVEDEYVRAVRGGLGFTKAAANYAASIKAGEVAKEKGYAQVLWLDGVSHKYVDEVGSMNMFFKFADELVTPPLGGAILPGITRDSVIRLAREMSLTINERNIAIEEIFEASKDGRLQEAFGTGTAAVISPVGELRWEDRSIVINDNRIGSLSQTLYDTLTGIQTGQRPDPYGWIVPVP